MSASHIPNLNTLRRGGGAGRGRFRGRGGVTGFAGDDSRYGTRIGGKDRVVQGTDNDASVSRMSAVGLGYIEDPFAKALTPPGLETRRLPIINRGTYVRTMAIDRLVSRFLEHNGQEGGRKQIISLGAGSDTRVFRLLSPGQRSDIVYHEIDFSVNTTAKIRMIRASPLLQQTVGVGRSSEVTISESGDALHSPSYHIHPLDLRSLSHRQSPAQENTQEKTPSIPEVDPTLPTLLISECCLIYLSPTEADNVVDYFTKTLFPESSQTKPLGLIVYEPIRPDDAFGRTMVSNLAERGIQLHTLHKYASLEAQRKRLSEHGFQSGQAAADVDYIWEQWVSEEEKERVAGLEMLDEMEEWRLLAQHYCVAWGWREAAGGGIFDEWKDIPSQS